MTREILSIEVDEDICLGSFSGCSELGTLNQQAQHGNDAAVLLIIQAIKPNGQPLTGLFFADFFVDAESSPSGSGVSKPDSIACPSCFADLGDGVYRLTIRPLVGLIWVQGTYILQMRIPVANATIYKLFNVEVIP